MKITMFSTKAYEETGKLWFKGGNDIKYYENEYKKVIKS